MRWLVFFTIAGLVAITLNFRFSAKKSALEPITRFFSWAKTINSFRAESLVLNTQQRTIGTTTFYFQNSDTWEMILADGGIIVSQWRFIDNALYVRDFADDSWWVDSVSRPVITSSVDFRSWAERAQHNSDSIRFVWQRNEPCGTTECLVYLVRDPAYEASRETIRHRLWLEKDTYSLVQAEYTGDTGTTITKYSEFDQVSLESPVLVKPLADGMSAYLAPGSIVASESAHLKVPYPFVAYLR